MEIVNLPVGQASAPEDDCIRIQQLSNGQFALGGTVLLTCGDSDSDEVVSLVSIDPYESQEAAEAAGLAWASDHCGQRINISRSRGTEPLPDAGD